MTSNVSELDAFRENSKQYNDALKKGREQGAYKISYTDITGKVHNMYYDGARYTDRENSMYKATNSKYKLSGTYEAEFKPPASWGNNQSYSEGAIHQKRVKELLTTLDKTKSQNGANRVRKSLEGVKNTIQKQIDTANYQISQGKTPSVDLPSLKKAMGDTNRAIETAKKKAKSSPVIGSGGRKTKF